MIDTGWKPHHLDTAPAMAAAPNTALMLMPYPQDVRLPAEGEVPHRSLLPHRITVGHAYGDLRFSTALLLGAPMVT